MDNIVISIENNPGLRLLLKDKNRKVKVDKFTNEKKEKEEKRKKEAGYV